MLEKVYFIAPVWLQNIFVSFKGTLNHFDRYGKYYKNERKFLREFDDYNIEDKYQYQLKETKSFLKYCQKHVEYYNDLDITKIDEAKNVQQLLEALPIVDKETLRENSSKFTTREKTKLIASSTGGTTGKSLVVYSKKEDLQKRMAQLDHFKAKVGFENLKMKRATFNGKHILGRNTSKKIFWRYNFPVKQLIFSSFDINDENLSYYIKKLNKFKPQAIDGFTSSIVDVSKYLLTNNIVLEFTPIAIFPTSETLTEADRAIIEAAFKAPVYNQYASSEGAPFITECSYQKLHINLNTGIFEKYKEGEDGEFLVTSFTTKGTPLIRYRIGDAFQLDTTGQSCSCGDESPIVHRIIGRKSDYLFKLDGTKIYSANLSNILKKTPNVVNKAQYVQEEQGKVSMKLVTSENFSHKDEDIIRREFREVFGNNTKLEIDYVENISREKSGKYRLIKNKLV